MNKKIYLTHCDSIANEGGMARNLAFFNYFNKRDVYVYNFFSTSFFKRFINLFLFLGYFCFFRNRKILVHQGTLIYVFTLHFFRISFFSKLLFSLLRRASLRNELYIEVNDLPYEQSIDLELEPGNLLLYKSFQEQLFNLKEAHFIFASNEMRRYAEQHYSLNGSHNSVALNGGPILQKQELHFVWMEDMRTKYVYAGSLNRGRQIEELITIFKNRKSTAILILLGSGGEWISELENCENIYYLGGFKESLAHYIVSQCDVGVIPYAIDRLYYNICYPTKVSFYLTAGINILTTPIQELKNYYSNHNSIYLLPINEWSAFIETDRRFSTLKRKEISEEFYWETILDSLCF